MQAVRVVKRIVGLLALLGATCLPLSQGWAADTTVIAAFGDSLFSGYGIAVEESFPAQLEKRLKQDGYNVSVVNYGISGDTTAGGVNRIDGIIQTKPDIILLELGANDLLRAVPPTETRNNMDIILQRVKAANIRMILTTMQAPNTLGVQFSTAYNGIYPEMAGKYGATLTPFLMSYVLGNPQYMQADGAHPNKDGVLVMVNNVYETVAKSLKK